MSRPPWLALAADADRVWFAMQKKDAKFIRLVADGLIVACNYDARGCHDLLRLAASGVEHYPNTKVLEVIAVTPTYTSEALTHRIVLFQSVTAQA
jgi:hypothetical protein